MLNKLSVSQLAKLSNLSKAYVSQVKHGIRPPSNKLIESLRRVAETDTKRGIDYRKAIDLFLQSRREGISQGTIQYYRKYLTKAVPYLGLTPTPRKIDSFLDSLSCSVGGKHAYYRALSVFYNWLYSFKAGLDFKPQNNPMASVEAPKRPKLILPSLNKEQVDILFSSAHSIRDKAIIALFVESGLRVSELANIKTYDIDWSTRTIKVLGKGNKEGCAPFGDVTEQHLRAWLEQYKPRDNEFIWDLKRRGIQQVMENLRGETGLPCNPHTFRRTFACLLRKAGVDTMTIKDLGRWESLEMVQRYTRSITFQDSLKFYKAPLS
jgi:site-specific recombinase XerD